MSEFGNCSICEKSLAQDEEVDMLCKDCKVSVIYIRGISPDIKDFTY